MTITKKNIFLSWLIALIATLSLSLTVEASTDIANAEPPEENLSLIFEENERLLNEMTEEMHDLLIQIESIHLQGGLPTVNLPLGIRLHTFDLLRGFVNGINIPLLVNIGGVARLEHALFSQFNYSTVLSGSLGFPNGILNGSNRVNNNALPQQSLEARIAAQEYVLYLTDAIRGALRLVAVMDSDNFDMAAMIDVLGGTRTFLEFNTTELNQRRNAMYAAFGRETVTMGSIIRTTRNVSDIVGSVDGGGYNLLIDLRNALIGGQRNIDILINVLGYAERVMTGEITEKYNQIDFTNAHAGVDQLFGYLIADLTEARDIIEQLDSLSGLLATLLIGDDGVVELVLSFFGDDLTGGIGAIVDDLIASQLPESLGLGLAHIMHDLLGDLDLDHLSTQDVLIYLDAAIIALEEMRASVQEINLDQGRRFVMDILSGEILDRYFALLDEPGPRIGTLLRYVRDDVDSAIAALKFADLLDQELAPLLGGRHISDLVKEYLIITLPHVINYELDSHITGLGNLGVGEIITELLAPVIVSFDMPTTIRHLQTISRSLSYIIPVYDRLENLLLESTLLSETEMADLLIFAAQLKDEALYWTQNLITNQIDQVANSSILQQLRETATQISSSIDAIQDVFNQEHTISDSFQQIRDRTHEMAREYREVGRNWVRDFLSNSQLYNYLRNFFRR